MNCINSALFTQIDPTYFACSTSNAGTAKTYSLAPKSPCTTIPPSIRYHPIFSSNNPVIEGSGLPCPQNTLGANKREKATADEDRTRNLRLRKATRYHCATTAFPTFFEARVSSEPRWAEHNPASPGGLPEHRRPRAYIVRGLLLGRSCGRWSAGGLGHDRRSTHLFLFRDVENIEQWHPRPAFHAERSTGQRQLRGQARPGDVGR